MRAVSATVSSIYGGYPAKNCIDGGSSFCHTLKEKAPWLALDFGADVTVETVVIRNRIDCCGDRFRNAEVRVADQPPDSGENMFTGGQLLGVFKGPGKKGEVVSLTSSTGGLRGRFVIVQIDHSQGAENLNLNEVTVWAKQQGSTTTTTSSIDAVTTTSTTTTTTTTTTTASTITTIRTGKTFERNQ